MTEEETHAFFESLAVSNADLQHSETRKAFVGDDANEWTKEVGNSKIAEFVLAMLPPKGRLSGSKYSYTDMHNISFDVLGKLPKTSTVNYVHERQITSKAKEIGLQVVARINYLVHEVNACPIDFSGFDVEAVRYEKVYYAEGWGGYRFSFQLRDNDDIEMNEAKWL